MTNAAPTQPYIAALWEHSGLTIAFFGVQFQSEEGQRLYAESGIQEELIASLEHAEGLLLNRPVMTEEGPVLIQYWRTYEDLDRFARVMPHSRWWKWLIAHEGHGLGFYHEIYQAQTAEAVFEAGTTPVGPALFCATETVKGGEGRSRERLRRFKEAVP